MSQVADETRKEFSSTGQGDATGRTRLQKLLPATFRTGGKNAAERTMDVTSENVTAFLHVELDVSRLNAIHRQLWLAGRPAFPRQLHVHRVKEREIVVSEKMDLHLVWQPKRIYIKPLPRFLLDAGFWQAHLCGKPARGSARSGGGDAATMLAGSTTSSGRGDGAAAANDDGTDGDGGVAALHECALGFLLSYVALVAHESDYRIARELGLLPDGVTWPQWVQLAAEVMSLRSRALASAREDMDRRGTRSGGGSGGGSNDGGGGSSSSSSSRVPRHLWPFPDVNRRFHYGELRLGRLNLVYRVWKGHLQYGYMGSNSAHASYGSYFRRNVGVLLTFFAYVTIVLGAMQVALATQRGASDAVLQLASYIFALAALTGPLAFLFAIAIATASLFIYNWREAVKFKRQRYAALEAQRSGNAAANQRADARPVLGNSDPV